MTSVSTVGFMPEESPLNREPDQSSRTREANGHQGNPNKPKGDYNDNQDKSSQKKWITEVRQLKRREWG